MNKFEQHEAEHLKLHHLRALCKPTSFIKKLKKIHNTIYLQFNPITLFNLPMQTPNKNKSRVVILSDSHLKGCTKRIHTDK
jgi:hypothetical protein